MDEKKMRDAAAKATEEKRKRMEAEMTQQAKDVKTQQKTNKAAAAYGYKNGGMVKQTPKATKYMCGGMVKK